MNEPSKEEQELDNSLERMVFLYYYLWWCFL